MCVDFWLGRGVSAPSFGIIQGPTVPRMTGCCLMGTVFIWEEKILEMDAGDKCTTL